MRKNFFKKKLASALTLAMVVASLVVPSTTASAASTTKVVKQGGKAAPTYLYVGDKGTDYGLSRTFKGNKYAWTISDSSIATINKAGVVTAKAPGTVTIKCTARNSKGKWLNAFTHKIITKLRVDSVDIGSEDFDLIIGEELDLNAVKNPSNSTDAIRYYSDNEEVATVDPLTGVVTGVAPGEATVTVYAKALWNTATTSTYNRTDSVKVTVVDGLQSVKQTTTNKVELSFATDQSDKLTIDNLTVTDSDGIKQVVKSISFSDDGKTATVEFYLDLDDGITYKVAYAEIEKTFTASVGSVASIVLGGKTVQYDTATDLDLKAFDKNGIDVTSTVSDLDDVEFDYEEADAYIEWDSDDDVWQITVYDYPKTLTVKATYTVFDSEKEEDVSFTSSAVIKSVEEIANTAADIKYTLLDETDYDNVDWDDKSNVVDTIPAEAENYQLFIKAKDQNGDDIYEWNFDSFESSDKSILNVSYDEDNKDEENTPVYVDPVKAGTAYIKAKYGNTTKLLKVTVGSAAKATRISANTTSIALSDSVALGGDSVVVELTVKDQYGNEMSYDDPVEVFHKSGDSQFIVDAVSGGDDLANNEVKFSLDAGTATSANDGNNTYELTLNDKTIKVTVKVNHVETGEKITKVGLEKSHTEIDAKAGETADTDKAVTYTVYGYNKSGVKVSKISNAKFTFTLGSDTVKDGNKGVKLEGVDASGVSAGGVVTFTALQLEGASGSVATQASVGTYKVKAEVTATDDNPKATLTASLKVTNSQVAPTVTQDKTSISIDDVSNVEDVIEEAFSIKRTGKSSDELDVVKAEFVVGSKSYDSAADLTGVDLTGGTTVRIKTITINEKLSSGAWVQHKVTVNKSVSITR